VREGLGWRFALEAAFLIALAVGMGIAELSATVIVVVMAVAWLLVCLLEVAVWAEGPRLPAVHRRTSVVEEPDEVTPREEDAEPAAVTEIREPEPEPEPEPEVRRGRFWRRRRAAAS
jgi:hypothetical protein